MPKIIKDIKMNILESALKQFNVIGYEKVSMRLIAKETGIAVGTLYNHYPNKEILFLNALELSWAETITDIRSKLKQLENKDSSINLFINLLYDAIVNRRGLGKVIFMKLSEKDDDSMTSFQNIFVDLQHQLMVLLKEHECIFPDRTAMTLVFAVKNLIDYFPDEREKNIEYLMNLYRR